MVSIQPYHADLERLLRDYYPGIQSMGIEEIVRNETDLLLGAILVELQRSNGRQTRATLDVQDADETTTYEAYNGIKTDGKARSLDFDVTAQTVVVHDVSSTVKVAFKSETDGDDDRWIRIEGADSPFTISGVNGIDTSSLWRRTPDGSETTISVIAIS